jgi:hypothetical protein
VRLRSRQRLTTATADRARLAGPFSTAELCEVVLKIAPETPGVPKPEAGSVAFWKDHKNVVRSDGSKAERELGIKYRTVEETATDSASAPPDLALARPSADLPVRFDLPVYNSLKAKNW